MDFRDKTILITGGSYGIGLALARDFAAAGANLILTARSRDKLEAAAAELAPARVDVLTADLADPADVTRLADELRRRFDRIDILVNNAGVGLYAPSFESDPDLLRRMFQLNVVAPVELTSRLLPLVPRGGWIVNVSSIVGKVPLPWLNLYSASKHALNAYSDALRMELDPSGIRVLSVCPGYVSTGFAKNVLQGELPGKVAGERRFGITAEQCSAAVLDGLRKGKSTIVAPGALWLFVAAAKLFPGFVYRKLVAVNAAARRDAASPNAAK